MAKKILAMVLSLTVAAACLAGCGESSSESKAESKAQVESKADAAEGENNENTESAEETPAAEELKAPVSDSEISLDQIPTENMLIRSVYREGDTSRLAAKIKAAKDLAADDSLSVEEKVEKSTKIAYLGDSITAGSAAGNGQNQYSKQLNAWWENNISYFVKYKNAGIGATDSYLAVHRVDAEVLAEEPDIIFIEFINDADNEFYKSTMESLVRKCLAQPNDPAVILVEMTMEDGTCPQNVHTQVAEQYDLPVISYHDAVLPEINAGTLKWKDISPDNIHPNDEGHVMLGKLLISFVENIANNIDSYNTTPSAFDPESASLTGDIYADATLCDKNSELVAVTEIDGFGEQTSPWNFQDGWAAPNGGTVTFELEFRNLGMLFYKTVDGESGTASVTVDGVEISEINADFTGGWGDYASNSQICSFDEKSVHTVTVSVPEGKKFEILRWMIS